jgi:hypothetical protein
MKPPIGFISLQDAAAMLHRKISKSNWHTFAECEAPLLVAELVAHEDPDIDRVFTMLAECCEAGDIATAYRSDNGGADDLDRSFWRLPDWRNYFITGMVDVDLPRTTNSPPPGWGAYAAGTFVVYERCTREIFLRRKDVERFISTLKPADSEPVEAPARAMPSSRGGRPSDVERIIAEAKKRLESKTYPSKAALARELREWLEKLPDATRDSRNNVMAVSTIHGHIAALFKEK